MESDARMSGVERRLSRMLAVDEVAAGATALKAEAALTKLAAKRSGSVIFVAMVGQFSYFMAYIIRPQSGHGSHQSGPRRRRVLLSDLSL